LTDLFPGLLEKVEAKRAVPRGDTNRDPLPKPATVTSALPNQSNFSSPSNQSMVHPSPPRHDHISSHTKIFVGGLHYDTRDGLIFF
jgi:hypothetical protein